MSTPFALAAREYARHGWHVFPLEPTGKRPHHTLAPHGFHEATRDIAPVDAWWREDPTANIGLHPAPSGLVVVDVDGPRARTLAARLGLLEAGEHSTLTVVTGRADGGWHLYFQHPGFPVTNRGLALGLEIRGDNGYVVLPPSVHPSGASYRWVGHLADIHPLPEAALARIRPQPATPETPEPAAERALTLAQPDERELAVRIAAYVERLPWPVAVGARNTTAFQLAAFLTRDLGLGRRQAREWLVEWNARACRPPLGARELEGVLRSAALHGQRAIGSGLVRSRS